jgi:hypothetical protein
MLHDASQPSSGRRISVLEETSGAAAGRGPARRANPRDHRPTIRDRALHFATKRRMRTRLTRSSGRFPSRKKSSKDATEGRQWQLTLAHLPGKMSLCESNNPSTGDPDLASSIMAIGCLAMKRVRTLGSPPSHLGGYCKASILTCSRRPRPRRSNGGHTRPLTSHRLLRRGP